MVLLVRGVLILAAGVHLLRATRIPAGALPLPGRVVDVEVQRSNLSADNRLLHGDSVEYRDPRTGALQVLPPDSHRPHALQVGDEVTLVHDPVTGLVRPATRARTSQVVMVLGFGTAVVVLGVLDLVG